jgi:hypothetical protein
MTDMIMLTIRASLFYWLFSTRYKQYLQPSGRRIQSRTEGLLKGLAVSTSRLSLRARIAADKAVRVDRINIVSIIGLDLESRCTHIAPAA